MNIKIKNFGAIVDADVKLDGITVICGDNNTGKSTVGKALFAFYNSLPKLNKAILSEKTDMLWREIKNWEHWNRPYALISCILNDYDSTDFIFQHPNHLELTDLEEYLQNHKIYLSKDEINSLLKRLNVPNSDVLNEKFYYELECLMGGQIKNVYSDDEEGEITIESQGVVSAIAIKDNSCKCEINTPIANSIYYIKNPSVLSLLNDIWWEPDIGAICQSVRDGSYYIDNSAISAIKRVLTDIRCGHVANTPDIAAIEIAKKIIQKAYKGEVITDDEGKHFYLVENGKKIDLKNLSDGVKSFVLIERMLATGVLKKEDILILDNPETYLHSEWQIIYAELIVALQKYLGLKILITTHSFQFLESLNFFMKKYEIFDKVNYYIPERIDKGVVMKSYSYNPDELYKNLSKGTFKIADLEYEFDMEQTEEDWM